MSNIYQGRSSQVETAQTVLTVAKLVSSYHTYNTNYTKDWPYETFRLVRLEPDRPDLLIRPYFYICDVKNLCMLNLT